VTLDLSPVSLPWNMPLRPDQAGRRETRGFRHVSGMPPTTHPAQCDRLAPAGSSSAARRESVSYTCRGASQVLAFLLRWTADMCAPGISVGAGLPTPGHSWAQTVQPDPAAQSK
jgi:hypothetical protein